jgi:hypothetical protein
MVECEINTVENSVVTATRGIELVGRRRRRSVRWKLGIDVCLAAQPHCAAYEQKKYPRDKATDVKQRIGCENPEPRCDSEKRQGNPNTSADTERVDLSGIQHVVLRMMGRARSNVFAGARLCIDRAPIR